jgi:hypothetical protein
MRSNNYSTANEFQAFSSSVCAVDCNLLLRVLSHAVGRNFRIGFSRKSQDNEA